MALRGGNDITPVGGETIDHTCDSAAEEGVFLVSQTAGSGDGLVNQTAVATLASDPSGMVPVGMLLQPVVTTDTTRYHLNWHKGEAKTDQKVRMLHLGRRTTNKVTGTPAYGSKAYLTANGVLTPTVSATGGTVATPPVGVFRSAKDEEGYATVDIDVVGARLR